MFIATALTLRGENNILSSSPPEAAHLIAKLQAGICRRDRHNGIEGGARGINIRRPALMISRIVSRSLFDVPVNKVGPVFSTRGSQAHAQSSNRAICLDHFLIRLEDRQRNNKPKPTGSKVLQQFLRGRQKANLSEAAQ
jgi:hypothetical protein